MRPVPLAAALALALAAAGCNQTAQAPAPAAAPPSPVTPAGFRLPEGAGCSGDVARFRAIQENDLKTGHVNQKVYDQIRGEIAEAEAACAAGRDAEARGLIAASRKRHGYPG
ncbi:MAG: hypothetical protein JNK46_09355 [Methylobacteriaceae bacterium]|nr:hypothetical protein [Methylobacteriaceae bacterium]